MWKNLAIFTIVFLGVLFFLIAKQPGSQHVAQELRSEGPTPLTEQEFADLQAWLKSGYKLEDWKIPYDLNEVKVEQEPPPVAIVKIEPTWVQWLSVRQYTQRPGKVLQAIKQYDPNYNDEQFKAFMMWNLERSFVNAKNHPDAMAWWEKFKTTPDAQSLRAFTKNYFGEDWCKKVLNLP